MRTILFLCLICSMAHAQLTGPAPVIDTVEYRYPESFIIDLANYTLEQRATVDSAKSALRQYGGLVKELLSDRTRDSLIILQQSKTIDALNKAQVKSDELDSLRKEQIEEGKPGIIDMIGSFLLDNAMTFIIVFGAIILVRKVDPFIK